MRLALLIAIFALVLIAIAALYLRSRRAPIVLGAELAAADARERVHREQFKDLPSPLRHADTRGRNR